MTFGPATYGLGLVAGVLSTLSPCVLPLVPVLVASAASAHRLGPLCLGAGLALSYLLMGLLVVPLGASLGLDPDLFRTVGAALLLLFGAVLLAPVLQGVFARATTGVADAGQRLLQRVTTEGPGGQLLVGLLLGVVRSPCVGPTLGAAATLASRGENTAQVALVMGLFGLGAAAPLMALGLLSRSMLLRVRGRLLAAGTVGRKILGVVLVVLATLILIHGDLVIQSWVLDHSPDWLVALTTRF